MTQIHFLISGTNFSLFLFLNVKTFISQKVENKKRKLSDEKSFGVAFYYKNSL